MATTYLNTGATASPYASTSTAQLNIAFDFTGDSALALDFQLFNSASPATSQVLNLANGDNTINATNCPALTYASGLVIVPPNGNGNAITIKGIGADTGLPISPIAPFIYPFAVTPPTSFVINTTGGITGVTLIWF